MPFSALLSAALATAAFGPSSAHFETREAAHCAAVYAFTLDAMIAAPNVPAAIRKNTRDGLASWEYELSASAPAKDPKHLQSAVDKAMQALYEKMPEGTGADAAVNRGEYLTRASAECAEALNTAYNGEEHPVMPFLRNADQRTGVPAPTVAAEAPAAPDPSRNGLR